MLYTKEQWQEFFTRAGFDKKEANAFSKVFHDNKIRQEIIKTIDMHDLIELGICLIGDRKLILRGIKQMNKTTTNSAPLLVPPKDKFKKMFQNAGFEERDTELYSDIFHQAKIRKETLGMIDNEDLKNIGIEKLGDRKLILLWIERNRKNTEMAPDPDPLPILSTGYCTDQFLNIGFDQEDAAALAKLFHENKIREEIMGMIDNSDLKDIGISALGDRKLLLRVTNQFMVEFRPKELSNEELKDELTDIKKRLNVLQLDVCLLHVGEAAAVILNEGFVSQRDTENDPNECEEKDTKTESITSSPAKPSEHSEQIQSPRQGQHDNNADKEEETKKTMKLKIVSPIHMKPLKHQSKKEKEKNDIKQAEYKHMLEKLRSNKNGISHKTKNEDSKFLKRNFDDALKCVEDLSDMDQNDAITNLIDYETIANMKRFKLDF